MGHCYVHFAFLFTLSITRVKPLPCGYTFASAGVVFLCVGTTVTCIDILNKMSIIWLHATAYYSQLVSYFTVSLIKVVISKAVCGIHAIDIFIDYVLTLIAPY